MSNLPADLNQELNRAYEARAKGNEGQARVCARRAAGIAIRDFFARHRILPSSRSAYDLLIQLKEQTPLPPHLKLVTDHLTLRVTEEFKLPVDADLVAESKTLCEWLLKN